jgi:CHAD domain-containing protein
LAALADAQRVRLIKTLRSRRLDAAQLRRVRIASRRLRELLGVAEMVGNDARMARIRRDLRRLGRVLGPVREMEVALIDLDLLGRDENLAGPADRIRPKLERELGRRRAALERWTDELDVEALEERLAHVGEDLAKRPADQRLRRALNLRLLQRLRSTAEAVGRCGTLYAPDRLHDLRLAIKKLRYAFELAQQAGHLEATRSLQALRRAQRRFGRLHDLQVLQALVVAAGAGRGAVPGLYVELVRDRLERDCRTLHAAIVADLPRFTERLDQMRAAIAGPLGGQRRPARATGALSGAAGRRDVRAAG